jgi:hypothetical protein
MVQQPCNRAAENDGVRRQLTPVGREVAAGGDDEPPSRDIEARGLRIVAQGPTTEYMTDATYSAVRQEGTDDPEAIDGAEDEAGGAGVEAEEDAPDDGLVADLAVNGDEGSLEQEAGREDGEVGEEAAEDGVGRKGEEAEKHGKGEIRA